MHRAQAVVCQICLCDGAGLPESAAFYGQRANTYGFEDGPADVGTSGGGDEEVDTTAEALTTADDGEPQSSSWR